MQPQRLHPVPTHDEASAAGPCPHEAALAEALEKISNLEKALLTARVISTAVGVLMATFKITSEAAFDMLVVASQNTHTKLRDVAQEVVDTGTLSWGRAMLEKPHDSARGLPRLQPSPRLPSTGGGS